MINGFADTQDIAEFIVRPVNLALLPEGAKLFVELSDTGTVRIFDGVFADSVAILGPGLPASVEIPIPTVTRSLGAEGLAAGTVTVSLVLRDADSNEMCRDEVLLTVIELDVKWYTWDNGQAGTLITEANVPHLDDPDTPEDESDSPANVGVRYFPGATAPGGGWNKDVAVVVATNPSVAGVRVQLMSFDVDDPSDDVGPVDDNGPAGGDNRGVGGGTFPGGSFTEGQTATGGPTNGTALAQFVVRVQPGDNHRVAASMKPSAVERLTHQVVPPGSPPPTLYQVPASDEQVPLFPGHISPLLTTWRKLHVEIDSMQAEPATVSGRIPDWASRGIDGIMNNVPPGQTTIALDDDLPSSEAHHYEGGTISAAGLVLTIFDNSSSSVIIDRTLTQNEIDQLLNATGIVRDDDPIPAQLPFYPSLGGFVLRAYASAYIAPIEATPAENTSNLVSFDLNLNDTEVQLGVGWDNEQNIFSEPAFWTALLVIAFQSSGNQDQDSDIQMGINGSVPSIPNPNPDLFIQVGITVEDGDNASVVFLETIRDIGAIAQKDLDHTIAHEMGHSAGNNISEEIEHNEGGIMSPGAPNFENNYSPETLARFRGVVKW